MFSVVSIHIKLCVRVCIADIHSAFTIVSTIACRVNSWCHTNYVATSRPLAPRPLLPITKPNQTRCLCGRGIIC